MNEIDMLREAVGNWRGSQRWVEHNYETFSGAPDRLRTMIQAVTLKAMCDGYNATQKVEINKILDSFFKKAKKPVIVPNPE
jgi:hypothetical protein